MLDGPKEESMRCVSGESTAGNPPIICATPPQQHLPSKCMSPDIPSKLQRSGPQDLKALLHRLMVQYIRRCRQSANQKTQQKNRVAPIADPRFSHGFYNLLQQLHTVLQAFLLRIWQSRGRQKPPLSFAYSNQGEYFSEDRIRLSRSPANLQAFRCPTSGTARAIHPQCGRLWTDR